MFITSAYAAADTAAKLGEEAVKKKNVFPPFDPSTFTSQLLWLAITFGIFYFLMARVVLPRIGNILEVRRDRISQDLEEAQRLKEETDASIAAYEQELAEARKNAHTIAREASETAKLAADKERQKTEAKLANTLAQAEQTVRKVKDAALAQIDTIASDTTQAIISRLIGTKVTKAELAKAISKIAK
ncbi:MAG: F0F1 ATP synthase subunit B [Rhizobiaceae bacterium]|nr:F0F1 ATP synthase subunit B [Rhizobiaceae bacterium]